MIQGTCRHFQVCITIFSLCGCIWHPRLSSQKEPYDGPGELLQKCGWWRRRQDFLLARGLPSNQVLQQLLPILYLGVAVIYSLADNLCNFVTGIFIPQYHFPFSVALSFGQVLLSILVLRLLHALGFLSLRPYCGQLGERLLVPALGLGAHSVLATWAKASGSSACLYRLVLPLLPVLTLVLGLCLKVASTPSVHVAVLVSVLSGTYVSVTVSQSLHGTEPLEFLYAPLALLLLALSLTWLAKVLEAERQQQPADARASVWDIYYVQLVNQSGILGLLWLLHPHSPWLVFGRGSWHSLLFHGYLLAVLLLGAVLHFLLATTSLGFSPLAGALLHSARQLVLPFFQIL